MLIHSYPFTSCEATMAKGSREIAPRTPVAVMRNLQSSKGASAVGWLLSGSPFRNNARGCRSAGTRHKNRPEFITDGASTSQLLPPLLENSIFTEAAGDPPLQVT